MSHKLKPILPLLFKSLALALTLAVLGAALGYWIALRRDPSGWSALPYALGSAIYAYGFSLGAIAYQLHRTVRRTPRLFNRIYFPVLAAFFAVIFFSEPLHLDFVPWLPYLLLVVIPWLTLAYLLVRIHAQDNQG